MVLWRPLRGRFMCPFEVAGLAMRYLHTIWASKFGAPVRNPALMAFRRDDIGGLHKLWWARNFTAFIFIVRAYENPAKYWCGAQPIQRPGRGRAATVGGSHVMRLAASACRSETHALRLEAACSSTCGPFAGVPGVVHIFPGVKGRVHRSVDGSLYPRKIILLLYFTTHFSSSNVMVHPALHNILMPKSKAFLIPGTICPINTVGRSGIVMSHVCVDVTFFHQAG